MGDWFPWIDFPILRRHKKPLENIPKNQLAVKKLEHIKLYRMKIVESFSLHWIFNNENWQKSDEVTSELNEG